MSRLHIPRLTHPQCWLDTVTPPASNRAKLKLINLAVVSVLLHGLEGVLLMSTHSKTQQKPLCPRPVCSRCSLPSDHQSWTHSKGRQGHIWNSLPNAPTNHQWHTANLWPRTHHPPHANQDAAMRNGWIVHAPTRALIMIPLNLPLHFVILFSCDTFCPLLFLLE